MLNSLTNLLIEFEGPIPDSDYITIARRATETDPGESVVVQYLSARLTELLGYCARHTPWLVKHPNAYWSEATEAYRQLLEFPEIQNDEFLQTFFEAKILLREGRQLPRHDLVGSAKASPQLLLAEKERTELLDRARRRFSRAADATADSEPLLNLCNQYALVAEHSLDELDAIKRIEGMLGTLEALLSSSPNHDLDDGVQTPPFESHLNSLSRLLEERFAKLAYARANEGECGDRFTTFASARMQATGAHMAEIACRHLNRLLDLMSRWAHSNKARQILFSRATELRKRQSEYADSAAHLFDEIGLKIRSESQRVLSQLWLTDGLIADLRTAFLVARTQESRLTREASEATAFDLAVAPELKGAHEAIADPKVRELIANHPTELGDFTSLPAGRVTKRISRKHGISPAETEVLQDDCGNRFLARLTAPGNLRLQRVVSTFSPSDPHAVSNVARTALRTSMAVNAALKGIESARNISRRTYADTLHVFQTRDFGKVSRSTAWRPLVTLIEGVMEDESAGQLTIPLQASLLNKNVYAWTMVEMFEVRTSKIRSGTLLTGRCSLEMTCPASGKRIQIGADPLLRGCFMFLFRGAQRDPLVQEYQDAVLKVIKATVTNLTDALNDELSYLVWTPEKCPVAIQAELDLLSKRLDTHHCLAEAMSHFSRVYAAFDGDAVTLPFVAEARKNIERSLNEAMDNTAAPGRHKSHLINERALNWLKVYLQAVLWSIEGMKARKDRHPNWRNYFQRAIKRLKRAIDEIGEVPPCYLLPSNNSSREVILGYMQSRLETTKGWFKWYDAESSETQEARRSGFGEASRHFDTAREVFARDIRDLRGATLAEARAIEARVRGELEGDPTDLQLDQVDRSMALYMAVNDEAGVFRTRELSGGSRLSRNILAQRTILSQPSKQPLPSPSVANDESYRFLVALSFAGEIRKRVEPIALRLAKILGKERVFYDKWYEDEIAGTDAHFELQRIYSSTTKMVVVCISPEYNDKVWPRDEYRAISSFERSTRKDERLRFLALRFGDGDIDGLPDTTIIPDARGRSDEHVAELIMSRLAKI